MILSEEKKGELLIFIEAIIFGLFPIITLSTYKYISPLYTYVFVSFFAVIFLGIFITYKQKWNEIKNKKALINVLYATFFITIIYFGLYFYGLQFTTAGNASIVALMEIFFAYIIFGIWQKQKHKPMHIIGAIMMVFGAIIVLFPGKITFNKGDLIILFATIFPPIGNHFQKLARMQIKSENILFIRTLISSVIISILLIIFSPFPEINNIINALPLLIFSGIVFFGIARIMWIEAIHRISVPKANSLSSIQPIFTLIFAYFILQETPTIWQISGFIPIFIGGYLITKKQKT